MGSRKTLTSEEFEWIRPYLGRIEEKNLRAIRRVLVDGLMQKNIAAEMNLTKEAVSALVARAWRAHLEHGERPNGWVKVEVVLPPDMARLVHEMVKIVRTKANK
jgi:DNA-directed RNA polymerase specialized sigma24 family protein